MAESNINLHCDASPLTSFAELLKLGLKGGDRSFCLNDLGTELVRSEVDDLSASTGEVIVRLYPSDAFLRLAATLVAGQL